MSVQVVTGPPLAEYTTLRTGGPAARMVTVSTEQELVETVRELDRADEPVLVLGGGSNLLVADAGFAGTVVRIATTGIQADESGCTGAIVKVAAGEHWDDFVAYAVEQEWSGVEALSGIPGLVGASPIQNVGAYGAEVAQTVETVRSLDRATGHLATFPMADCRFGYRTSRFKREPERYVVLSVTFQFRLASRSAPIRYAELAGRLGVDVGARSTSREVRQAVLELRRDKGMVLEPTDHDTWSAGSFFTNPIVAAAAVPEGAPRWDAGDDLVKTSAAWLIEHAGFGKGYGSGPARLSSKHTLALTNRGSATTRDLLALAREVRAGVEAVYGITLVPEPVLVGCRL